MQLSIEVLPAPLGPMMEKTWPCSTWKLTSLNARTPPKPIDTSDTSRMGPLTRHAPAIGRGRRRRSRARETCRRERRRSPRQSSQSTAPSRAGHEALPPLAGGRIVRFHKKLGTNQGQVSTWSRRRDRLPPSGRGRARLLRRLEQRRRAGAELLEQRRLVGLGGLEVAQLDVAEAANLLRDGGEANRDVVVVGIELRQDLLEQRLVVAHERALGPPLGRIAERIEGGAAQELEFRQQPEQRENPRTERHLPRLAADLVLAGKQRRRQMHVQAKILAAELGVHLLEEGVVGVEASDLVFVLVGHQLEQIARDRVGEPALARRARGLDRPHLLDEAAVARGIGRVLVGGEEGDAALDHLVERARQRPRVADRLRRGLDQRLDR